MIGDFISDFIGNMAAEERASAANEFSASQAQQNREFQERMSGTSYQRAIKDMQSAGLNPMLAYSQGGATTPAGNAAAGQVAQQPNFKSGSASMQTAAQVENVEADTKKKEQETRNLQAEEDFYRGKGALQREEIERTAQDTVRIKQEAARVLEQAHLTRVQQNLVWQEIENAIEENRQIRARTGNIEVDTVLKKLEQPEAENRAGHHETYKNYRRHVSPFIHDAGSVLNSASQATGTGLRARMNKYIIHGK